MPYLFKTYVCEHKHKQIEFIYMTKNILPHTQLIYSVAYVSLVIHRWNTIFLPKEFSIKFHVGFVCTPITNFQFACRTLVYLYTYATQYNTFFKLLAILKYFSGGDVIGLPDIIHLKKKILCSNAAYIS